MEPMDRLVQQVLPERVFREIQAQPALQVLMALTGLPVRKVLPVPQELEQRAQQEQMEIMG